MHMFCYWQTWPSESNHTSKISRVKVADTERRKIHLLNAKRNDCCGNSFLKGKAKSHGLLLVNYRCPKRISNCGLFFLLKSLPNWDSKLLTCSYNASDSFFVRLIYVIYMKCPTQLNAQPHSSKGPKLSDSSKGPKLSGAFRVAYLVSLKRRRLEARNFAVILIFISFTTDQTTSFTE